MNILVRTANLDTDLADMHALTEELGYPCSFKDFKNRILITHKDAKYQTLVIELDQKVIGYLGYIQQNAWEFDGSFYRIQALVITNNFRNKGLGKKLLKHLESVAVENGISLIVLNSGNRPERNEAHAFYLKYGFEAKSTGFRKEIGL